MSARAWTRALLVATVLVSGFAGEILDRALVATPAWRAVGATGWAAFSRHADLGAGLVLYPAYGLGLLALAVATAVAFRLDAGRPRAAGAPIYLAAVFAVLVMASTAVAAPIMLGVPGLHTAAALESAFDQFTLWGVYIRGAFGVLAFVCSLWALTRYTRLAWTPRTPRPPSDTGDIPPKSPAHRP